MVLKFNDFDSLMVLTNFLKKQRYALEDNSVDIEHLTITFIDDTITERFDFNSLASELGIELTIKYST